MASPIPSPESTRAIVRKGPIVTCAAHDGPHVFEGACVEAFTVPPGQPCGHCANLWQGRQGPECLVPRAGGEILRGEALPLGRTCAAYRKAV